ncbi:MAG: glycoside hydrolase family 9 protein [Oscillospiraceae bacterium]|nr:glycoside hydrolase family 9 protein [Oscillospiraceae bacterium]
MKHTQTIHLNQLGYAPNAVKKAVLPVDASEFSIVCTVENAVVFNGKASEKVYSEGSREWVRIADFTALTRQGEYVLVAKSGESAQSAQSPQSCELAQSPQSCESPQSPETAQSPESAQSPQSPQSCESPQSARSCESAQSPQPPQSCESPQFKITPTPYAELRRALLDFYEYQKCGVAVDAGPWSHPPCHTSIGFVIDENGAKTGVTKDVAGGWHDAGDYGRYIVPSAATVAQLLLANNPDLLDVVWFEVEWMLKMQDEVSGGIYHKVSCRNFNPLNEMPHDEHDELVICPISAEATADFAASMALAARFYPQYSQKLLTSATSAWDWCMKNLHFAESNSGFKNPPTVTTGPYGNTSIKSKYFWAACELFGATGEQKYHDYIKTAEISAGVHWKESGTFGILAYLRSAKADSAIAARMKKTLLDRAGEIITACNADPYGVSLGVDYRWGSNGDIGNNAMTLLLAEQFADIANSANKYREYAAEHLNYLLGKNPLGKCYVSGFGANPLKHPHHRPSVAVGEAVPGMVSGGPCGNTSFEPILHSHCANQPPMKCFIDHHESFSSNEITIYWNAPFYFLLSEQEIMNNE